jgi:predicted DCC family thiol-disulfide oxidoreductase YuxK
MINFFKKGEKLKCAPPNVLLHKDEIKLKEGVPLMLWDGECGFCSRAVTRWSNLTGGKVEYIPYQFFEVTADGRLKDFPELSVDDCRKSVQLILPDGRHFSAAEAVFYALAIAGRKKYLYWLYRHLPGFKWLSEFVYRFVASRRHWF